jgi:hypothetical protein
MLLQVTLTLILTNGWVPAQGHTPIHRIHGSVVDTELKGINAAKLELTQHADQYSAQTGEDGTYSTLLPDGSYTLKVTAEGYCPYIQDEIGFADDSLLNVTLLDCSGCPEMTIDFVQPLVEPNVPPPPPVDFRTLVFKYKEETLGGGDRLSESSVLFGRRNDKADLIEYTGLDCPGKNKLAILKYKGGSLKASKISVAKKNHRITAEGSVTVVDKRGTKRGSLAAIDLAVEAPEAVILK